MIPINVGDPIIILSATNIDVTADFYEIADNDHVIRTITPLPELSQSGILLLRATHNPPAHLGTGGNINVANEVALNGHKVNILVYIFQFNIWELVN